jgi:cytochrome c oxidase subunit 3
MPSQTAADRASGAPDEGAPLTRFGGGPPSGPPEGTEPPVSNARLALLMFIGAEVMLFAGLLGAYLVLRYGSSVWPPAGQPRLPIAVTLANTATLALSALSVRRAWTGIRAGNRERLRRGMAATAVLGLVFLGVQGSEWLRLVRHGLSLSSTYGATFAALIGLHGLHALGALVAVGVVLWRTNGWRYSARHCTGVELCATYWIFVCALWLALFTLVYLG